MRHLRFSLFDLFVITLGVATGLAYHRAPGVSWLDALLVMCAAWIVVGMAQQARSIYGRWWGISNTDRELRRGAMLALMRPLAVVAMLAAAVGFEVVKEPELDLNETLASDAFTSSLFSLAIICAYIAPGRAAITTPTPRSSVVQTAIGVVTLLLGCVWLVYVLVNAQTISGLVHMAIRGVQNGQPTRWGDKPLYPYDPQVQLTAQFFRGAIVAATAAAVSAISTVLLILHWNSLAIRRLLIGTSLAGIAIAAYFVHWYWTVGFPAVSPLLAVNMGTQPWYVWGAGISVFAGACFLFAMRYVPEPRSNDYAMKTPRPYHLFGSVMGILLFAMIISAIPSWWDFGFLGSLWGSPTLIDDLQNWWDGGAGLLQLPMLLLQIVFGLAGYWIEEPKMLLRLGAVLVVIHQLRRWRRGEPTVESLAPVRIAKLVTVTGLVAATLAVAIPAGAWLGFAIVTTPIAGF